MEVDDVSTKGIDGSDNRTGADNVVDTLMVAMPITNCAVIDCCDEMVLLECTVTERLSSTAMLPN